MVSSTLCLKLWRPAEQKLSCKSKINLSSTSMFHQLLVWNCDGQQSRSWVVNQKSIFHQLSSTSMFHQLSVWNCDVKQSCQSKINQKSIVHQHQSNINFSSILNLKLGWPAEQKLSCQSKINLSSTSIKHQPFINYDFILMNERYFFQFMLFRLMKQWHSFVFHWHIAYILMMFDYVDKWLIFWW